MRSQCCFAKLDYITPRMACDLLGESNKTLQLINTWKYRSRKYTSRDNFMTADLCIGPHLIYRDQICFNGGLTINLLMEKAASSWKMHIPVVNNLKVILLICANCITL